MNDYQKRSKPYLGTFVEIGLATDNPLHPAFNSAFAKLESIQNCMSFHTPYSELSTLNRHPQEWITLSKDTLQVLAYAKRLAQTTDELFNCTVGGELVLKGLLPNHFNHAFLKAGNSEDIQLNATAVRLAKPVLITLDGIAQGYAVDQAIVCIQAAGVQSGWVNAGGDIRAFGDCQLPIILREQNLSNTPALRLNNKAIASSQIGIHASQRFPSHIVLNKPHTQSAGLISVIAPEAWLADGLTKVLGQCQPDVREDMAKRFQAEYLWQEIPTKRQGIQK